jgi:GT2 family glycosyltransferase
MKYLLVIPFYKNEIFIDNIISWYNNCESFFDRELIDEVLVVNDCPDSVGSDFLKDKCESVGFKYFQNEFNIGYLQTVNNAYLRAKNSSNNLILLNSDAIPFPGFVSEINKAFESDNMLGVVSVRSNNATICNLYNSVDYYDDKKSLNVYSRDLLTFNKYIKPISYTPVVTGFCFSIRNSVLQNFKGFDKVFTVGYEEENEFCLRISQRGFRIGIANKAFVAHMEGRSFGLKSGRDKIRYSNSLIIRKLYPHYDVLIDNYSASVDKCVQSNVSRSLSNDVKYLVDARVLSSCFNGSNNVITQFIKALSSLKFVVDVLADNNAVKFHGIDNLDGVNYIGKVDDVYEFGFLIGQPMHHESLWTVPLHSLVSTCIFFDTIAHDCPQLRADNLALDSIWRLIPFIYTDISFISEHSKHQYFLKFGGGLANLHCHLLPIIFNQSSRNDEVSSKSTLVFGNKFSHKGLDIFLRDLDVDDDTKYYVLGPRIQCSNPNIIFLEPGQTDDATLNKIRSNVDYFIFPSFAEGFGFPLLEAISYNKPIYCRDIACYREIAKSLSFENRNLVRFVDDFKCIHKFSVEHDEWPPEHYSADYISYLLKIFESIQNRSSFDFNNLLTLRQQLINVSFDNSSASNFAVLSLSPLNILKRIYHYLLTTPFGGSVRSFKNYLFSFPFILKIVRFK